ncbi:hypothetical protein GLOIN_2v1665788 [Rhizophagus irregularis DAOM 181602=DAOM 197198]|uniref:Uncharacterized protein n=1 Tax=Rhizophagus irregularis (strain DAOM 181602 / DAOM 197198 / MUCL 43194) TaxID=747089 RepID=A0A2P4PJD6_RHIID|nr:hypothetical protein GLOIN_2v1665788 [Rhizophagus irregularis DAOM 181602=DAOM 197198]POG65504.1 hypothetical protein GLOIN_2v1665788 [Rhizophagus irregularis DAOM 181602=DAOM 197198]|eukprot:XP_025172370.1 hypothetical protein GLOIN_2v1665788 [Rhizophagus irregularis DAOM 181602=DAOM 197198]
MVNVTLLFFSGLLWSCVRILLLGDIWTRSRKLWLFFTLLSYFYNWFLFLSV